MSNYSNTISAFTFSASLQAKGTKFTSFLTKGMNFILYVRDEVNLVPMTVFSDACSTINISTEIGKLCVRRLVSDRPQTKEKPHYVPEYGCFLGMLKFR